MGYLENIATLTAMRDDLVSKDSATQRLLEVIVSYNGDPTLAQTIIDADVAIQTLILAAMSTVAASMTTQAAVVPTDVAVLVQAQQVVIPTPPVLDAPVS